MKKSDDIDSLLKYIHSEASLITDGNPLDNIVFTNRINEENVSFDIINSDSSKIYLLKFIESNSIYLLKMRKISIEKEREYLKSEIKAYLFLQEIMKVPQIIWYGIYQEYEVVVYNYLNGVIPINTTLNSSIIYNLWTATLKIQNELYINRVDLQLSNNRRFDLKLAEFTLNTFGRKINEGNVNLINEHLNSTRFEKYYTVFSDRSPANWILSKGEVIPIDFDLMLIEPCLSDFIQFIDDYRFITAYNRSDLIKMCLTFLKQNGILFSEKDFHVNAIYRNLIQGAVFYDTNKYASRFCYEKAKQSANIINLNPLQTEISRILRDYYRL